MKILVVDDSRVIQNVLRVHLSPLDAHLVVAGSAEEALEAYERESFDLLISDVHLPGMSGIELARHVKESSGGQVRVILISGGRESESEDSYEHGRADAFLAKPVDSQRLLFLVRSLLGRASGEHRRPFIATRDRPVSIVAANDTRVGRRLLERIIDTDPAFELLSMASDGDEALEMALASTPELILLDVPMPGLSTVELTKRIMRQAPTRIVLVSDSTSPSSAKLAFDALEAGALDLVRAPSFVEPDSPEAEELRDVLKKLATVTVRGEERTSGATLHVRKPVEQPRPAELVAICAATGGPQALVRILPRIRPALRHAPVVIAQQFFHDLDVGLARWLRDTTGVPVQLATDGLRLHKGTVIVAPAGYHLTLTDADRVGLRDDSPNAGPRPSGTLLFESVAKHWGSACVGVVLSGLGDDALAGARRLRSVGATVLAQSAMSCVADEMPDALAAEGLPAAQLPPDELAAAICARVEGHAGTGTVPASGAS